MSLCDNPLQNKLSSIWKIPLTETELLKRDAKRNIGEELLATIRDIKAGHRGANYSIEPNQVAAKHPEALREMHRI